MIDPSELNEWFPCQLQRYYIERLTRRVGLTRRRAECFVRLCAYLWLKEQELSRGKNQNEMTVLKPPRGWVQCTCREAKELFYNGSDKGSERAAGMMVDMLVQLNLVEKNFDGNTLNLSVTLLPELSGEEKSDGQHSFVIDDFNHRRDGILVGNLLAEKYSWMAQTAEILPLRIARLIRSWAEVYGKGMRVLRRSGSNNPIGFYILFPTKSESEKNFFQPASNGLYLSSTANEDPFEMALPGDKQCRAVFLRSWIIDKPYQDEAQPLLLKDAQQVLRDMNQDFPNLSDLYTLIIHPSYENLAKYLGYQKITGDSKSSMYWVYMPLDDYLEREIPDQLPWSVC